MIWISPRRDGENAKTMAEHMADGYERHLGRSLTPEELQIVHDRACGVAANWGSHARLVADREQALGRKLTPEELAELVREAVAGWDATMSGKESSDE